MASKHKILKLRLEGAQCVAHIVHSAAPLRVDVDAGEEECASLMRSSRRGALFLRSKLKLGTVAIH